MDVRGARNQLFSENTDQKIQILALKIQIWRKKIWNCGPNSYGIDQFYFGIGIEQFRIEIDQLGIEIEIDQEFLIFQEIEHLCCNVVYLDASNALS